MVQDFLFFFPTHSKFLEDVLFVLSMYGRKDLFLFWVDFIHTDESLSCLSFNSQEGVYPVGGFVQQGSLYNGKVYPVRVWTNGRVYTVGRFIWWEFGQWGSLYSGKVYPVRVWTMGELVQLEGLSSENLDNGGVGTVGRFIQWEFGQWGSWYSGKVYPVRVWAMGESVSYAEIYICRIYYFLKHWDESFFSISEKVLYNFTSPI